MSQLKVQQGNDFILNIICMKQVTSETQEAFDISESSNVSVNLYCEQHDEYVTINDWELEDGTSNVIKCNISGSSLHAGTKYGLVISGIDPDGQNFKTKIRGRNFLYVVASVNDLTNNDFITNPLAISVTMNMMSELKPIEFDDFATITYVDDAINDLSTSLSSTYATKTQLSNLSSTVSSNSTAIGTLQHDILNLSGTVDGIDQNLETVWYNVEALSGSKADKSDTYTKSEVDDMIASITGGGGGSSDVTKAYVDAEIQGAKDYADDQVALVEGDIDDAVSGIYENITNLKSTYLEFSPYADKPLTFYNNTNEAVELAFGNLGCVPDSFGFSADDAMTSWRIDVSDGTYDENICADHESQGDNNYISVTIPAGEHAIVTGNINNTHGWLSFASSDVLEVEGNAGSLYNEDYMCNSGSSENYSRMFSLVDNPVYSFQNGDPIQLLQVEDYSNVFIDYTNYNNDQTYYNLNGLFFNNTFVTKGPVLVQFKSSSNHSATSLYHGCTKLSEATDYSYATAFDWNYLFPIYDDSVKEEYFAYNNGFTFNMLKLTPINNDDRLLGGWLDGKVTVKYLDKDFKAPYITIPALAKGIQSNIDNVNNNANEAKTEAANAKSAINSIKYKTHHAEPFYVRAIEREQTFYIKAINGEDYTSTLPLEGNNSGGLEWIEYAVLYETDNWYDLNAYDSEEDFSWTRIYPDTVEYDGQTYENSILPLTITLTDANYRCYIRAKGTRFGGENDRHNIIYMHDDGLYEVGGNIMSLINGEYFNGTYISNDKDNTLEFAYLFFHSIMLRNASTLFIPMQNGGNQSFRQMFRDCVLLEAGPQLYNITKGWFYPDSYMFKNCARLTMAYYLSVDECPSGNVFQNDPAGTVDDDPWGFPDPDNYGRIPSSGTLYVNKNRTWANDPSEFLPENWTIVDIDLAVDYLTTDDAEYIYSDIEYLYYLVDDNYSRTEEAYNKASVDFAWLDEYQDATFDINVDINDVAKYYLINEEHALEGDCTVNINAQDGVYELTLWRFATAATFSSLSIGTYDKYAFIGDDFTSLEPSKHYEVMFERSNDITLISWAEIGTVITN